MSGIISEPVIQKAERLRLDFKSQKHWAEYTQYWYFSCRNDLTEWRLYSIVSSDEPDDYMWHVEDKDTIVKTGHNNLEGFLAVIDEYYGAK